MMTGDVPYMSAAIDAKKKPVATRGEKLSALPCFFSAEGCVARCVTREPATMRTPPATCRIVQGSRRTTTARISVTTAFSCMTGAVRFTPAAWLARKLQ